MNDTNEQVLAELRAIRRLLEGPTPVQRQPNAIDEFLMAGRTVPVRWEPNVIDELLMGGRTLGQGIKTADQ